MLSVNMIMIRNIETYNINIINFYQNKKFHGRKDSSIALIAVCYRVRGLLVVFVV